MSNVLHPSRPFIRASHPLMRPLFILRMEGAVLLGACIAAYAILGHSWWLFAGLFLAPDLFMIGYLFGPRPGSVLYNAGHTTILPAALGTGAILAHMPAAEACAIIWLAHIGFDRLAGYGLKYPDAFGHTHLGGGTMSAG